MITKLISYCIVFTAIIIIEAPNSVGPAALMDSGINFDECKKEKVVVKIPYHMECHQTADSSCNINCILLSRQF